MEATNSCHICKPISYLIVRGYYIVVVKRSNHIGHHNLQFTKIKKPMQQHDNAMPSYRESVRNGTWIIYINTTNRSIRTHPQQKLVFHLFRCK